MGHHNGCKKQTKKNIAFSQVDIVKKPEESDYEEICDKKRPGTPENTSVKGEDKDEQC